jgi:hypothetical protein
VYVEVPCFACAVIFFAFRSLIQWHRTRPADGAYVLHACRVLAAVYNKLGKVVFLDPLKYDLEGAISDGCAA